MTSINKNNLLSLSWTDPIRCHQLNKDNVLDYFSQRSNSFYDTSCNNETLRMQNRPLHHLTAMRGVEYALVHHQDPIMFVIRKQKRLSQSKVETIADYYIVAGVVYQSPDLGSIINSRLMSSLYHLDAAFKEALANARYHPAKGYSWQMDDLYHTSVTSKEKEDESTSDKSLGCTMFQMMQTQSLIGMLEKKFPAVVATSENNKNTKTDINTQNAVKTNINKQVQKTNSETKTEN